MQFVLIFIFIFYYFQPLQKQKWLRFLFVVKAAALKQQISKILSAKFKQRR